MSCLETESEDIKEWKTRINQRNACNKRLKNAIKRSLTCGGSSHMNLIAEENLIQVLREQDRLHGHLIESCKSLLPENVFRDIFNSEIIKKENSYLIKENEKLKKEKQRQKQRYEETIKLNNQKHQNQSQEQQKTDKKLEELTTYCKFLESQISVLESRNDGPDPEIANHIENLKADFRSKERRFEETLRAQNSLIEDLKRQLEKEKNKLKNLPIQNVFQQTNEQADNIQFENKNRKTQDYRELMLQSQQKCQKLLEEFHENEIDALETNAGSLEHQLQNSHEENYKLQDLEKEIKILKPLSDRYRRNDTSSIATSDH